MGDNCEACRTNTDPRKVPVHPNCNCEVITQNVVTGVDVNVWQPVEQWIRENGTLRFVQGNIGRPVAGGTPTAVEATGDPLMDITMEALTFEPSTMMVLDLDEARWSDIERWLSLVEPLIASGEHIVSIVSETEEAVATAEAIALGHEVLGEIVGRRLFIGLLKVGIG